MGATVLSLLLFSTWYETDINWFVCKQTHSFLSKLKQTKEVFPSSAVSKVDFVTSSQTLDDSYFGCFDASLTTTNIHRNRAAHWGYIVD